MSEGLHPGVHPDGDLLSAFAESALPERERMECLAHLAKCTQCREVVFLAQKAAEIEEPVAVPKAPVPFWQRFLGRMVVGSVVAAAIVAVLSFGLYRTNRPTEPQTAEPQPKLIASAKAPVETAPVAKVEEQKLPPTPRKASPRAVPKPEQPPASVEPAPLIAVPPAVASAPPPAVPPAPVTPAAPVAEVAGVTGTIIDPAGAVIARAQVELKNEDTGAKYTSTSDESGQYRIAGLAPGRYDFSVSSPGFKRYMRAGVDVQPQEMARVDSKLDVGSATDSVMVTEAAPLLKTESGELSHQVNSNSLDQLPLLTAGRGNFSAATPASPVYTLPDKSAPVSVATRDKLVVAVDSAGALFISENAGKSWTRVKATWKGKAVRVAVSANAMFELTTDPASNWVSTDGRHWSKARAPR